MAARYICIDYLSKPARPGSCNIYHPHTHRSVQIKNEEFNMSQLSSCFFFYFPGNDKFGKDENHDNSVIKCENTI